MSDFKICAISGSLRKKSYNTAILHAAKGLAPAGVSIDVVEIGDLPFYNEDLREGLSFPPAVASFRQKIKDADALLFGVAEYNYSFSGVLKNAIDWASRAPEQPFNFKAYGMLGVATGAFGTSRAQTAMRTVLFAVNAFSVNAPQVMIANAAQKFDERGAFTDQPGRELIKQHLDALVTLAGKLGS